MTNVSRHSFAKMDGHQQPSSTEVWSISKGPSSQRRFPRPCSDATRHQSEHDAIAHGPIREHIDSFPHSGWREEVTYGHAHEGLILLLGHFGLCEKRNSTKEREKERRMEGRLESRATKTEASRWDVLGMGEEEARRKNLTERKKRKSLEEIKSVGRAKGFLPR